jgi:hypothetical protein
MKNIREKAQETQGNPFCDFCAFSRLFQINIFIYAKSIKRGQI